MKFLTKYRCVLLISLAVCISLIVGIILLSRIKIFEPLPADKKIRAVTADQHGVTYFITQSNELYVGGIHDDSFGLYESGFRWNIVYGLYRIFAGGEPVLFTKNVDQVFSATNGFLYTDTDMNLYYFGDIREGMHTFIARDVIHASMCNSNVLYVCNDGSVYFTTLSEECLEEAILVANDGKQVLADQLSALILTNSGTLYQIETGKEYFATIEQQLQPIAFDVKTIQGCMAGNCFITVNDELTYCAWGQNGWGRIPFSDGEIISDNVLFADYSDRENVVIITKSGELVMIDQNVVVFKNDSASERREKRKTVLISFNSGDIIDFDAGPNSILVLFSDGSYQEFKDRGTGRNH